MIVLPDIARSACQHRVFNVEATQGSGDLVAFQLASTAVDLYAQAGRRPRGVASPWCCQSFDLLAHRLVAAAADAWIRTLETEARRRH